MNITVSFSPFTFDSSKTTLVFKTAHQIKGGQLFLLENPAELPKFGPDSQYTECIPAICDRLICSKSSIYFRIRVNPIVDQAPTYYQIIKKPISFEDIRKKYEKYDSIDAFIDDFNLMVSNAMTYNKKEHDVYQNAIKLSFELKELLEQMKKNPSEMKVNKHKEEAVKYIEMAIRQNLNAEKGKNPKKNEIKKSFAKSAKKFNQSELEEIINGIMKLKSSALVGVVEILKEANINDVVFPINVNLDSLDESVLERLKVFVKSCKDDNNDNFSYSWRPILPKEILEIKEKYKNELEKWKLPPE